METINYPPVYNESLPPSNNYNVIVFHGICGIKKRVSKKIIDKALSCGIFNWVEERTGRSKLALVSIYRVDEILTSPFELRTHMYDSIVTKLRECELLK